MADVDGDGSPEVAVSVGHASPVLLSGDGELLRRVPTMGPAQHIPVADLTRDGKPEFIAAGPGAIQALALDYESFHNPRRSGILARQCCFSGYETASSRGP